MTQEEKIKHFLDVVVEDAKNKNKVVVCEYEDSLNKIYAEHVKAEEEKYEARFKVMKEAVIREKNTDISKAQIELRRKFALKQEEIKSALQSEVNKKLCEYKMTDAYVDLLVNQVRKAEEYSQGEDIVIYIDSSDEDKTEILKKHTHGEVKVSEDKMIGGVRAVIRSKNVMIDESFYSKLTEEIRNFSIV